MEYKVNDKSWETLFWSLLTTLEEADDLDGDDLEELVEVFEQAGLQLDSDENGV